MAYHIDKNDNSIVINGFANGIADSPYDGISDMRNCNIISIPGEASVNFQTFQISSSTIPAGTITSASAANDTITFTGATNLEGGMAILPVGGSLPAGITSGTIYWIGSITGGGTTATLYSDASLTTLINITSTGTGVFSIFTIAQPTYFTYNSRTGSYYVVDTTGKVWTNSRVTFASGGTGTGGHWIYLGNRIPTQTFTNGNGLVYYQSSNGTDFLFVFHNSSIDYIINPDSNTPTWIYQWNPNDGTAVGYAATPTKRLNTPVAVPNPHEAIVAPDNKVYYVDANWVGRWYQADPNVTFDPTTPATYIYDQTAILPFTDIGQCLAPLGNNLLIGGQKNIVYPWDTFSSLPSFPIFIAESNIKKLVTVNTNTYIFVGNRGRIYYTNGSQAQLFKKIPDHLSGTVEPYYAWGGATSSKNQLYFSASVTSNAGVAINQYGGVWAIDLDTKAIRLTNKLSYGTYAGYSTALIPNFGTTPAGTGIYIGWDSGSTTYGIDATFNPVTLVSSPYSGSQAIVISDLIPIGTFDKPTDFERMEYKLSRPLVAGESVTLYARLIFNTSDTGFGTAILTDSTAGNFSSSAPINFKNAQWLQLQAVLNSTASSPSYVRLTEIRIKRPSS